MTFTSSNLKVAYGEYSGLTLVGQQPNMPTKEAITIMGKNRLSLGK